MTDSISIIIPTHNRAPILPRVLNSLRHIDIPAGATVELLIIANACTDLTATLVRLCAATLPFPARCIEEPQPGLNHARNRGLRESTGNILAFLDDDVSVDPSWLSGLLDVFHHQPASLVAGRVTLCWDDTPRPAWINQRSAHLLSCVDHGDFPIELHKPGLAVGANLAFRRSVPDSIGPFSNGLDRIGGLILGGGDTDFLSRALAAGHRMFYAPNASLRHHVIPQRATTGYLFAASYGNGLTRVFFQNPFPPRVASWILIQQTYRVIAYTLLAALCTALFLRKPAIHHRIRRNYSGGMLVGAVRRLRGRSPAGIRIPQPALNPIP